jgi:hypothetical protein
MVHLVGRGVLYGIIIIFSINLILRLAYGPTRGPDVLSGHAEEIEQCDTSSGTAKTAN